MKKISGKVVSTKMAKTLVVEVRKQRLHPLYKKIIRRSKKYKVHYDNGEIKTGDLVEIKSCRPISKEKHYLLVGKI